MRSGILATTLYRFFLQFRTRSVQGSRAISCNILWFHLEYDDLRVPQAVEELAKDEAIVPRDCLVRLWPPLLFGQVGIHCPFPLLTIAQELDVPAMMGSRGATHRTASLQQAGLHTWSAAERPPPAC